jgi:hypothetical protein
MLLKVVPRAKLAVHKDLITYRLVEVDVACFGPV